MAIRSTGNHPSRSTFAAIAYHYLREAEPDAFTRMTTLGFAGTWLGQQLTGEAAIDPTQASYTGVYHTTGSGLEWLPGALDALEMDADVLPAVREPISILGQITPGAAQLLGIPAGIPVSVGCADTPATDAGCIPGLSLVRRAGMVVALGAEEALNDTPRQYLNRLSDLMFVLARVLNRHRDDGLPGDDVYWRSERLRQGGAD